jgi:two-component system cell cycle response regulator
MTPVRKPKPKHILIADDDLVTVHMLSGVLKAGGFEISVAADAMQAVMLAMRKPFDAVILDIGMPGGTGFQVLERLKATAKTSAVPVIVITGLTDPALPGRVQALGANEFFSKPVAPDKLREALDRLLAPPADTPPPS